MDGMDGIHGRERRWTAWNGFARLTLGSSSSGAVHLNLNLEID